MKIARRSILIPVALIALVLPATVPFWQPDFIFTADSPLHLWRIYELDRALASGAFYPRWAPDLYFGYGYPVFNFYPPLAYYAVELLHLLGLDIANGLKAISSLGILLAAAGMFLLARDFYAPALKKGWQVDVASLMSAVAYAYTPYLLIDVYIRGAVAEILGMALLPFYVWALRRLMTQPGLGNILLSGVIGAIFLVAHNLTALFSAPLILGYLLLRLLFLPSSRARLQSAGGAALSGILSLLLSAFYLLPEVFELPSVYIGQPRLSQAALLQTILDHIQPLAHVVQLSWLYDYPEGSFPLGLASVTLGVAGFLLGLIWLKREQRLELGYWMVVALLVVFSLIEWSRPIWLALPALWVIQFVWRLTVFSALGLALAAGAWAVAAARLVHRNWVVALVALLVVGNLVGTSVVNLRAKPWPTQMPPESNPEVLARYEVDFRETGMSSMNEYLPVWTQTLPLPNGRPGRPPTSQNAATQAPDIKLASLSLRDVRLAVNVPQATMLSFRTFYYPDWQAWIDDQPASVHPSTEVGLLTIDVPAGSHQVWLQHGSLPVRDAGIALTGIGLLAVAAGLVVLIRRRDAGWKAVAVFVAATLLAFLGPQVRAVGASIPSIQPVQLDLDSELRLIGFQVDNSSPSTLKLHLFWQVKQFIARENPLRVQLSDDSGRIWSTRTQLPRYGTAGMRFWIPNEIAEDEYDLYLPRDLPAGTLTLQIAREGEPPLAITRVTVNATRSAQADPVIENALDGTFGDSIRLLGFNAPALAHIRPGQRLETTLFWRAEADLQEDFTVFFQLLDSNGRLVAQNDSLPNNGFSPTMLWAPGATIADRRNLQLPDTLDPGMYHLVAGLYRFRTLQRLQVSTQAGPAQDDFVELAAIKIHPNADFTPDHRLDVRLGPAIRVQGFTLVAKDKSGASLAKATGDGPARLTTLASGRLQLTMEWLADQTVSTDYTVFVHLLDANGKLVRQQDNPPVNGKYGTQLWDVGEHIPDPYSLDLNGLPPGDYRLVTGMYRPDTGERLPVTDSKGQPLPNAEVELARVQVTP